MNRRELLAALLGTAPALTIGCARPTPKTPLAHLYGHAWIEGAYELYAKRYLKLQQRTDATTDRAYAVLGASGVPTLGNLQHRGVPFFIRANTSNLRFGVQREVPERLTFTADMSAKQREEATAAWKKATEHIQQDYRDIHKVDGALGSLFGQLVHVRSTVDHTQDERFQLADQIGALAEGPPPFALPYQVSKRDYRNVLLLLLGRLEGDSARLQRSESAMISVGLTTRATDAGSGSLGGNLYKVLLATREDQEATPPASAKFPSKQEHFKRSVSDGESAYRRILKEPAYIERQKQRERAKWRQIGSLLTILDNITGLPTSAVFNTAVNILSGQHDYLGYIEAVAGLTPSGSKLSGALHAAVDNTRMVRKRLRQVSDVTQHAELGGVVNVGSDFARTRLQRQLVFYRDDTEWQQVRSALMPSGWL